ncbi:MULTISPECIES: DUF1697 domain-containing protein [unclassified Isoptericola]|uniref:DUF1697 domain-containing protein n=1 Tax=unclassified Isoptericola TaxID=2623355 RepID=UPI002713AD56|nr:MULTISPECIES: DUF1697 domain-containing protein [unclassified Isoptericola]MDO8148281.1 DUF1697 domain-containing protein [Isoptericola sp. b515]MDO8151762.1 DUF1697 domain-containing protein [Isoptericola sp. b408]
MHVAFFRNLNQGQRSQPTTADLRAVFAEAGAAVAEPYRSNGTVVFAGDDPDAVVDDVLTALAVRTSYHDLVLVRPLAFLEQVVDRHAGPDAHRCELTLFPGTTVIADDVLAHEAGRRRCAVVDRGPGWAVVQNDRDRQSNGTPALEAAGARRATSRGVPTLAGLVERFGG